MGCRTIQQVFQQTLLWGKQAQHSPAWGIPHPSCAHRATCAAQGMGFARFRGRTRDKLCHATLTSGCRQRERLCRAHISEPIVEQAQPG